MLFSLEMRSIRLSQRGFESFLVFLLCSAGEENAANRASSVNVTVMQLSDLENINAR